MPVTFNATFKVSPKTVNAGFNSTIQIKGKVPSDDLPLMDGDASAGISVQYSRSDHRHPHDSYKMDYMSPISNLMLEEMLT